MPRFARLILLLLIAVLVPAVGNAWAESSHHQMVPGSSAQPSLLFDTGNDDVFQGNRQGAGHGEDCDGVCGTCCAAACGPTDLTRAAVTAGRYLSGVPVRFAMTSYSHGWKTSPPLPPPRR